MESAYQEPKEAQKYLNFLDSPNGRVQRQILSASILARLPKNHDAKILDAACGPGWLTKILSTNFTHAEGCDISPVLIQTAQKNSPQINFKIVDILKPIPYGVNFFDTIILNMAGPDLADLATAFKNLSAVLKPAGQILITIPNPAYTYPAAVWKRSWLDILLGKKPQLKIKTPPKAGHINREFNKGQTIASYFYSLNDYLTAANKAGLQHAQTTELRSQTDSLNFDLNYQMYRYPLILLLEFSKNEGNPR